MTPEQNAQAVVSAIDRHLEAPGPDSRAALGAALTSALARLASQVCTAPGCEEGEDLTRCEACGRPVCRPHVTNEDNPHYPNARYPVGVVARRCPACVGRPFPAPAPADDTTNPPAPTAPV